VTHGEYVSNGVEALIPLSATTLDNILANHRMMSQQSSKCALILQRTYITKDRSKAPNFGGFFDLFQNFQQK
jgi:hypothetical protein